MQEVFGSYLNLNMGGFLTTEYLSILTNKNPRLAQQRVEKISCVMHKALTRCLTIVEQIALFVGHDMNDNARFTHRYLKKA